MPASPFGREQELAELRQRLAKRSSFLFWGPAGGGKTLLLRLALADLPQSEYVYCPLMQTPGDALRQITGALRDTGDAFIRDRLGRQAVDSKSSVALRGLVRGALQRNARLLILDHTGFVSKQFLGFLKDLSLLCNVPLLTVARSAHMEEIGYLETLYWERRTRWELKNFDPPAAAAFAIRVADAHGLSAENREEFLTSVVENSQGNPGAILRMIEMAGLPRYRREGQIRSNILYVDYCVGSPGVRK